MAEILTDRKTEAPKSAETSSDGAEKKPDVQTSTPADAKKAKRVSEFAFHVKPNRWFRIKGEYFGPGGTVTVNGVQAVTESWSTTEIEGKVPEGVNSGEVVVHVDDKIKKYGYFNAH